MSNVKITQLPSASTAANSDVFPVVASSTTSQITLQNLANALPQVTSSISASYASSALSASYAVSASYEITYETSSSYADFAMTASYVTTAQTASYVTTAQTASYYSFASTGIVSSSAQFTNLNSPFTGSFTGSFVGDGSQLTGLAAFPYTGSAEITGSLGITGSLRILSGSISILSSSFQNSVVVANSQGLIANRIFPVNYYNLDWTDSTIAATEKPGFPYFYVGASNSGTAGAGGSTYYLADVNIGQNLTSFKAGILKFSRNTGTVVPNVEFFTLVSNGNNVSDFVVNWQTANGRDHTLTVTGSMLTRGGVTLGTAIGDQHYISGSLNATGSFTWRGSTDISNTSAAATSMTVQNGHIVLTQVSASLNFVDDAAAAAGGVPLGGLYRNGNFIVIRIS